MKKLLSILSVCALFSTYSYAQKGGAAAAQTYVSAAAKLEKYFTEEELNKLGKLELTQIYMSRVVALVEIMPYIALHPKPGATLEEMGIRKSDGNLKHVENANKNKSAYITAMKVTLEDVVPYADKVNMIKCILFYEEIIKKTESL